MSYFQIFSDKRQLTNELKSLKTLRNCADVSAFCPYNAYYVWNVILCETLPLSKNSSQLNICRDILCVYFVLEIILISFQTNKWFIERLFRYLVNIFCALMDWQPRTAPELRLHFIILTKWLISTQIEILSTN